MNIQQWYRSLLALALVLLSQQAVWAQGTTCANAAPFCSNSGATFPAGTNQPTPGANNNYDCLGSQPNPAWYYLQIANPGNITIRLTNSAGRDVDFILWGPFPDLVAAQAACGNMGRGGANGNVIDCSYSSSAIEDVDITNAQTGQVYMLLITNYSNQPTNITANVTAGNTATTDCSILFPCDSVRFNNITANSPYQCTGAPVDLRANPITAYGRLGITPGFKFQVRTDANSATQNTLRIYDGPNATGNVVAYWGPTNSGGNYQGALPNNATFQGVVEYLNPTGSYSFQWCDSGNNGTFATEIRHSTRNTVISSSTINGSAGCTVINLGSPLGTGVFSGPGVTTNNNGTGTFNPAGLGPGSYTITYNWSSGTGTTACVGSFSRTVHVCCDTFTNLISVSPNDSVCSGQNITLSTPFTGGGGPLAFTNNTATALTASATRTSTISVTGVQPTSLVNGTIQSVCVNLTNNMVANLNITLISPSGTRIDLSSGNGGITNTTALTNVCFSPTATTPITNFGAPFSPAIPGNASYLPEQPFSNFNGTNSNGNWILEINNSASTAGQLLNWTINFAAPDPTYTWTGAGLACTTCPSPTAAPTNNGDYAVTIVDVFGCRFDDTISVFILPGALAPPNGTCASVTNTSISFGWSAVTGATGYEVSLDTGLTWIAPNNGSQNHDINGLGPGDSRMLLVRAIGGTCIANPADTIICTTLNCPLTSTHTLTAVSCNGGSNGTATININGAVGVLSYQMISPSMGATQASNVFNGLAAGTYIVQIHDPTAACSINDTFTITEPTLLSLANSVTSNYNGAQISCNSGSDGQLTATPSGGTTPYSYLWQNGQTTAIATGFAVGNHTVTVTDANGCTTTATVSISEPSAVTASIANTVSVSCFGGNNGSAAAQGSGGTGSSYTFVWSTSPAQTGATATGLAVGTYTVTVSDANGCIATTNATITQPTAVTASISSSTSVSCFGGSNGSASAAASGGSGSYTFQWSNGQTGATTTGLSAGTVYTVTATDANNCQSSATVTVSEPSAVSASTTSSTATSCNGGSDGSLSAAGGGGVGSYSFVWSSSPAQTGATATGLAAGSYTVTVSDANGCTAIATGNVSEPSAVSVTASVTSNYNGAQVSCNGGNDGVAQASGSGGVGSFGYVWSSSPAQSNAVATGLSAGSYTVTATDANGCTISTSITVSEPSVVTASASAVSVSCFGGTDGSVSAQGTGGTGSYSFSWSNGRTTATATGLGAGNYTVSVFDANNCVATATTTISQPAAALSQSLSNTAVLCFGGSTGTATSTPAGGTAPYSYVWSNGQTGAVATGLAAGNYQVTASDANGCTISGNTTVGAGTPINQSISSTDATCFGLANGTATFNVSGGVGGFSFQWQNGQTGSVATGLAAGSYCVTASDANGCTVSNCATVNQPSAMSNVAFVTTNILCAGQTNGTASVTLTGGIQPYRYNWSNGRTTVNITGLAAGTYQVTVSDANNCTITGTTTITEPAALSVTIVTDSVRCRGANTGRAIATASGGVGPYSYLWSNSHNSPNNLNLTAGTYGLTVTDFNGCRINSSAVIGQPANQVTANINNVQGASCFGAADGTATAVGGGGTPGYTFQWSDGQVTPVATGMTGGSYRVTVTDTRGCSATAVTTITQPAAITANAQVFSNYNGANVTCPGAADGSARVLASGGTGTLTYAWSSIPTQVSNVATGLAAGNYTVTVTDGTGCSVSRSVTLVNPVALAATFTQQNIFCNGQRTGQILVNATPGTGTLGINGYEYAIFGPNQVGGVFSNVNSFFGLGAGTYTVIVRDGNNCQLPLSITLTEPTALTAAMSSTAVDCNGSNNGTATASPTGGTSPYRYRWNNGQTNQTAVGLGAGGYVVTVTDNNGCDVVSNITITQPSALGATVTSTGVSCNGASNGSASVQVTGGVSPYSFQWSNGQTNQNASNFTVGSHSVTISDANNCRLVRNFSIGQPSVLAVSTTRTNASCNGSATGTATANPTGGTAPYSYQWDNGQTGRIASGLVAGAYTVLVIDANGCSANAIVTIGQPNAVQATIVSQTNISCNGGSNGRATVSASGGTAPFRYLWSNGQTTAAASGLSAGVHQVTVSDAANCSVVTSVNLIQPTALLVDTLFIQDVRCRGGNDGQITARATGGTAPYSFVWSNGRSGATVSGLTAGSYRVTATDANGCTTSRQGIVSQPVSSLVATTNATNALCNGSSTGQMVAIVSGGTPLANGDYNYLWSNGATTSLVTSVSAGNYTVTVSDANGCSLTRSVNIGQAGSINLSITNRVNVSCFGGNNGSATAVASGGTGQLSFQWSDLAGQTTTTATGLSAGTYYVEVSDQNGCSRRDSVVISQDAQVQLGSVVTNVSCFGGNNGSIRLTSPSRPISLYQWSTGAVGASQNQVNNLSAGNYQVTVTTNLGCTATFDYTVTQPDSFSLAVNLVSGLACATDTNAVVEVSPVGGTANYRYSWSNGVTTTNVRLSNLDAGAYTVIATDRNGCTAVGSISILAPSPIAILTTVTDATCAGAANGAIQVSATGGTLPDGLYEFSVDSANWQTGNYFPALVGNVYRVYARDDNGCVMSVQTTVQDGDPFFIVSATADTTMQYGDTLNLEVELNDTAGVRVRWSIVGSGNPVLDSSNYRLPVTPMEETIYQFVAVNGPGCSLDTQIVVRLEKRRYVNAPTGFTPNGDGVNDRFFVQGENEKISKVKMFRVYDRWGELVYEIQDVQMNDPQAGWNGLFRDQRMNSGVFAWYAEVEFIDGKVEVFKGDVTLLR